MLHSAGACVLCDDANAVDLVFSELLQSVFLPVGGCFDAKIAASSWFEETSAMVRMSSLPLCAMARSA